LLARRARLLRAALAIDRDTADPAQAQPGCASR
jgi:hypothetical protein